MLNLSALDVVRGAAEAASFLLEGDCCMDTRMANAKEHGAILSYYGREKSWFFNLFFGVFGLVFLAGWTWAFTSNAVNEGASPVERVMALPWLVQGILLVFAVSFLRMIFRNPNALKNQLENREYQVMDVFCHRYITINVDSDSTLENQRALIKVYDTEGNKIASRVIVSGQAAYDHERKNAAASYRSTNRRFVVRTCFDSVKVPVLLIVPNRGRKRYGLPRNII